MQIQDISIGLLLWQLFVFILWAAIIYFVFKLVRKLYKRL